MFSQTALFQVGNELELVHFNRRKHNISAACVERIWEGATVFLEDCVSSWYTGWDMLG